MLPAPQFHVELSGRPSYPQLILRAPKDATLPNSRNNYGTWVRQLPGRHWDPARRAWVITGLGAGDPYATLAAAGLGIVLDARAPWMDGVDLRMLVDPIAQLDEQGRSLRIRHRLAGFEVARSRLAPSARWVKQEAWFIMPVTDAQTGGRLRPGVVWPEGVLERALAELRPTRTFPPEVEAFASVLATAADFPSDPAIRSSWTAWTDRIPDWFGLELYPYQRLGVIGALLGHGFLADAPGVGKTRTALAIAATKASRRTLILCPPVMTTTWGREALAAHLPTHGGTMPDGKLATIVAGRKEPELPTSGVVVVADSLLAKRAQLRSKLAAWAPEVLIYDEAHRAMTVGSQRSEAALELARASGFTIPLTGTPMLSSPHQLVPLLDMSGHLGPVFGGAAAFLERYCSPTPFGSWRPRRSHLRELGEQLRRHVWIRRDKKTVLPWLPQKIREELPVRVPLGAYRTAHKEVIGEITEWVSAVVQSKGQLPDDDEIAAYASDNLRHISKLRSAAGVCKVPAAADWLELHDFGAQADGTFDAPVIVWTHHQEVTHAMAEAVPSSLGTAEVIRGGTPPAERDRIVQAFQAGNVPVLVASITAAGVGLTLTRSSTALFVETDWTPALIVQAEDRANRIGSERKLIATTIIAEGTLDEHIQQVLRHKGHVLGAVTGGDTQVSVSANAELETASELLERLVREAVATFPGKR